MPSASSGRYQSRLFNFFHQQSRRWGEQFERTVRQIQVTTSWSIEGLLHSVYMLIQKAVESSNRQLNTAEEKRSLRLQGHATDSQQPSPQSADDAVARVLKVVPTLQFKDKETREQGDRDKRFFPSRYFPIFHYPHPFVLHSPTPQSPSPSSQLQIANSQYIQGVASNLANRNLVLVAANNEILDVLTFQQQKKLQNRIYEELRTYESQQVNLIETTLDEAQLLPEIDRLLNKLISGKQDNEPVLLPEAIAEDTTTPKSLPISLQGLAILDETIAKLEATTLVPISRTSSELLQIVQTQLNIFLYGKNQSITNKEKVLSTEVGENQTANVLSLIWEAIHYFFGEQRNKSFEQTDPSISSDRSLPEERKLHRQFQFSGQSPSSKALPETSQFQDGETVDPWLTMDDLFNHSPQIYEVNREPQISESSSNTNFTLPETFSERENIWHYFQSKTSKLKKMLGSVNRQISDLGLPQSAKKRRNHNSRQKLRIGTNSSSSFQKLMVGNFDSQITDFDSQKTTGEATKSYRETEAIEAKPDWIETSARTIGYVKHPLEFILEWLDRAILWLERILVNIFLFFKGLLHGK